jgi:hypothetical protein
MAWCSIIVKQASFLSRPLCPGIMSSSNLKLLSHSGQSTRACQTQHFSDKWELKWQSREFVVIAHAQIKARSMFCPLLLWWVTGIEWSFREMGLPPANWQTVGVLASFAKQFHLPSFWAIRRRFELYVFLMMDLTDLFQVPVTSDEHINICSAWCSYQSTETCWWNAENWRAIVLNGFKNSTENHESGHHFFTSILPSTSSISVIKLFKFNQHKD